MTTTGDLDAMADRDVATGAYGPDAYREYLGAHHPLARRTFRPLSLIWVELDGFDGLDAAFSTSDIVQIEKRIAALLADKLRAQDVVARLRPGRFALILPETDGFGVKVVVERVRLKVATATLGLGQSRPLVLTASFGVVTLNPTDFPTRQSLENAAGTALRVSQEKGGNRATVYSERLSTVSAAG